MIDADQGGPVESESQGVKGMFDTLAFRREQEKSQERRALASNELLAEAKEELAKHDAARERRKKERKERRRQLGINKLDPPQTPSGG